MIKVPFRHILVPIDGSEPSAVAIGLALRLTPTDGRVTFANAINLAAIIDESVTPYGGDPSIVLEALESERHVLFATALARAELDEVQAQTVELTGPPADAIVNLVPRIGADAIVMGTHGRQGLARAALGSVADGVLRSAPVPVFVVHAASVIASPPGPLIRRILVAVDASTAAASATGIAAELAGAYSASLVFIHVGDADAATDLAFARARDLAASRGIEADVVRGYGEACDALLTAADAMHADLIAIGTHGRAGASRLILGSVAEGVLSRARLPVLVVREKVAQLAPPVARAS